MLWKIFVHFCFSSLLSYLHSLKLMSHTHVCINILLLHLIQNLALNQKNSLNYIYYSVFPFLLPIAVLSWSCCPVSELAALVRAFAVDFHLVCPAPCRRDNQVPIHIYLLWDLSACFSIFGSSFREGMSMSSFLFCMAR